jgi:hypothetical protein
MTVMLEFAKDRDGALRAIGLVKTERDRYPAKRRRRPYDQFGPMGDHEAFFRRFYEAKRKERTRAKARADAMADLRKLRPPAEYDESEYFGGSEGDGRSKPWRPVI